MDSQNKITLGQNVAADANVDASDYFIKDAGIGGDILKEIKGMKIIETDDMIYGVSDETNRTFSQKIDDFLINHSKISLKDKSYFFHMLAVMVDSGVPVIHSVKTLAGYTENARFRRVLNTVAHNCEVGSTLADAMSRFADVFSEAEV